MPHAVTKATITMKEAPVIDVAPLHRRSSKHHFRLGLLTSTKFAKRDLCFSALDHIAADAAHNDALWPIFITGILDAPAVMEDFVRRCNDVSRALFIDVLCPWLPQLSFRRIFQQSWTPFQPLSERQQSPAVQAHLHLHRGFSAQSSLRFPQDFPVLMLVDFPAAAAAAAAAACSCDATVLRDWQMSPAGTGLHRDYSNPCKAGHGLDFFQRRPSNQAPLPRFLGIPTLESGTLV